MQSHRCEADGKETPKPAPIGFPVDSQLAARSLPASPEMQQAGRAVCPDLVFFRSEVTRRSAPGFRFPPSPPVPLRPARPSYSRPSSLQSGPPLLGTAREPPWPRPGWRPSGPRRPAQAEGSGLPDSGCDLKGTRNRSGGTAASRNAEVRISEPHFRPRPEACGATLRTPQRP